MYKKVLFVGRADYRMLQNLKAIRREIECGEQNEKVKSPKWKMKKKVLDI